MILRALAVLALCLAPLGAQAQSLGQSGNADYLPASQTISAADAASTSTSGYGGQSIVTGTPTANSAAAQATNGKQSATVQLTGTWTGTIFFEQSIDGGTTWVQLQCVVQSVQGGCYNQVTGNGLIELNTANATNIRARASAWTSGTATVLFAFSRGAKSFSVTNAVRVGSGTAGSFVQSTFKSAAAAATGDNALVVEQAPNPAPECTGVLAINQTASTDLHTMTNTGYICAALLISATAQNVSLVQGTGTTCATGTVGLIGGTTASVAVAANSGFSSIADRPWLKMTSSAQHLCLLQSGTGNVSGTITYVDAP